MDNASAPGPHLSQRIVPPQVVSSCAGDTTFSAPPPLGKWASCVSSPVAASAAEKCPCAAERSLVAKYVHPGAAVSAHARAPFSKANVAVAGEVRNIG